MCGKCHLKRNIHEIEEKEKKSASGCNFGMFHVLNSKRYLCTFFSRLWSAERKRDIFLHLHLSWKRFFSLLLFHCIRSTTACVSKGHAVLHKPFHSNIFFCCSVVFFFSFFVCICITISATFSSFSACKIGRTMPKKRKTQTQTHTKWKKTQTNRQAKYSWSIHTICVYRSHI